MPFVMLIAGVLALALAIRGDPPALGAMVTEDFGGRQGFATFALAFIAVGAIGLYDPLRPASRAFLVLMIVALVLANGRNGLLTKAGDEWARITGAIGASGKDVRPRAN